MTAIFAPGLPLVHGPHLTDELAAWAAHRIAHVGADGFGPCWAVGVARAGALAAVVVYSRWDEAAGTVQMSVASVTPKWASRPVFSALLGVPFRAIFGAPVRKIWAVTPFQNSRARKFLAGVGMVQEAVLREQFAKGEHAVCFGMMAREYRAKYGG